MIVAANREINPDHVVGERHHGIERGRTRVIAHARAHPGNACLRCLLDGCHRSKAHDQMPDAIIAIDQGACRPLPDDADIRTRIDPARLEPAQIDRQPDHAVGVAAAQTGVDHEPSDDFCVVLRQSGCDERARGESDQGRRRDARRLGCSCCFGVSGGLSRHMRSVPSLPHHARA